MSYELSPDQHDTQPQEASARFEAAMTAYAETIPELAARPEILEAGHLLIDQFDLQASLFDDEGRSLVFASLAARCADQIAAEVPYNDEDEFIDCTLALLAAKHSDTLADATKPASKGERGYSDETLLGVYDKYTDAALSKEIDEAIRHGGLLDELKAQLGVNEENEDHFVVRALSIGSDYLTYGLEAPAIDYDAIDYADPSDRAVLEQNGELRADIKAWKEGLKKRRDEFSRQFGGVHAEAWVTVLNGEQNLCISSALAEKLLSPELTRNTKYYSDDDRARDLAMLKHEYTHTQGGINVDGELAFGMGIEELRAELYSGNMLGYHDVKGFYRDYKLITGHDMSHELAQHTKGGAQEEIFSAIANEVGLRELVSVVTAQPNNYAEHQSNGLMRRVLKHTGGLDGTLATLLQERMARGDGAEVEARIEAAAKRMIEISEESGRVSLEMLADFRRNHGLHVMTDLIYDKAQQILAQREVAA